MPSGGPVGWKALGLLSKENRQEGRGEGMRRHESPLQRFLPGSSFPDTNSGLPWGLRNASRAVGIIFVLYPVPFVLSIWVIHIIKPPKRLGMQDCLWQRGHGGDLLQALEVQWIRRQLRIFLQGSHFSFASTPSTLSHCPSPQLLFLQCLP